MTEPINSARYSQKRTAIQEQFDYVLWLDSDMVFPTNTLHILRQDLEDHPDIGMVTGLYVKRMAPITPVLYSRLEPPAKNADGRMEKRIDDFIDYPRNTLFLAAGCGFGCVLTRVSLLKEVWDHYGPAFTPYPWAGEDISFCHRVNLLGQNRIWCDSKVSCGHVGLTVYTENNLKRGEKH